MYSCEVVEKWVTKLFTLKSVAVGNPCGELTVNIHMTKSSFGRINLSNLEIELRGKISGKSGHEYKKQKQKSLGYRTSGVQLNLFSRTGKNVVHV